ncbi:hypothetical protein EVAR_101875_1 [Eumeta japonica]|uniref:Uncharacterized protein n=1 Tax=Eumeta variegata TaxID=151549 RepID=A0A4C1SNR9_EUMVA|nr:hypothetical protein EVAR_101875_1 [Eumeta japonica]
MFSVTDLLHSERYVYFGLVRTRMKMLRQALCLKKKKALCKQFLNSGRTEQRRKVCIGSHAHEGVPGNAGYVEVYRVHDEFFSGGSITELEMINEIHLIGILRFSTQCCFILKSVSIAYNKDMSLTCVIFSRVVYTAIFCVNYYERCSRYSIIGFIAVYVVTAVDLTQALNAACFSLIWVRMKMFRKELGRKSSFAIFFSLACSFPYIMVNLYLVLKDLKEGVVIASVIPILFECLEIVLLPCLPGIVTECIASETDKIKSILLHRLVDCQGAQGRDKEDIQLFLQYVESRPFQYRLWRTISVDGQLLLNLISLCTTVKNDNDEVGGAHADEAHEQAGVHGDGPPDGEPTRAGFYVFQKLEQMSELHDDDEVGGAHADEAHEQAGVHGDGPPDGEPTRAGFYVFQKLEQMSELHDDDEVGGAHADEAHEQAGVHGDGPPDGEPTRAGFYVFQKLEQMSELHDDDEVGGAHADEAYEQAGVHGDGPPDGGAHADEAHEQAGVHGEGPPDGEPTRAGFYVFQKLEQMSELHDDDEVGGAHADEAHEQAGVHGDGPPDGEPTRAVFNIFQKHFNVVTFSFL